MLRIPADHLPFSVVFGQAKVLKSNYQLTRSFLVLGIRGFEECKFQWTGISCLFASDTCQKCLEAKKTEVWFANELEKGCSGCSPWYPGSPQSALLARKLHFIRCRFGHRMSCMPGTFCVPIAKDIELAKESFCLPFDGSCGFWPLPLTCCMCQVAEGYAFDAPGVDV